MARDFLLPAWLVVGGSGTKFSLLGENRLKRAVSGVPGEFCTGWAAELDTPGEFCTGWAAELDTPGEFCTGARHGGRPHRPACPSESVLVTCPGQALGAHGGDQPVGAQARQRHPHDAHRDPTERRHGLVEDEHGDEELQGRSQVL